MKAGEERERKRGRELKKEGESFAESVDGTSGNGM